jgi:hypothetical protein
MKLLTEYEGDHEEYETNGILAQYLVSVEEPGGPAEGVQGVGLSHLLPRAYLLIEDPGWWVVWREDGDIAMP